MPFIPVHLTCSSSDGHNFTLLVPFDFVTSWGETITVPAGSESDGASTPKEIWNLIPPFGSYWRAAFLHDYLYRYTQLDKDYCDRVLLDAMAQLGTLKLECDVIYEGVHIGGDLAFDEDRHIVWKTTLKQRLKGLWLRLQLVVHGLAAIFRVLMRGSAKLPLYSASLPPS